MPEPELLPEARPTAGSARRGQPATDRPGPASSTASPGDSGADVLPGPLGPLLGRLNQRGFRLVMLADTVGLLTIMVGSMVVRFGSRWPTYPLQTYLLSFTVITAIFLAALYFGGLYEREPRLGAPPVLPRAARQTLAAGGLTALADLVVSGAIRELGMGATRALPMPIPNLIALIVLGAAVVAGNRMLVHWLRTRREGPPKVVLAGDAADLDVARGPLAAEPHRARIVAELTDPTEVVEAMATHGATDLVVVSSGWLQPLYPTVLTRLDEAGVTTMLRVTARETVYGLERVREVAGLPFVLLRTQTMPRSRARFKRFVDVVLLVAAAPVWVPVLGMMGLYQLAVARRPVLYRQERVGAGGRTFELIKFRTMVPDAEADGRGARLAEADDPRVLPACRWVRASRMDELPQLWNVVRGEMSLVGPRPERPEMTARFEQRIPGYARRHELPPGLTGLAQIHGRYDTDAEYKLGYDLQYLVNWSPVLDLQILLRTVWVVLARRL